MTSVYGTFDTIKKNHPHEKNKTIKATTEYILFEKEIRKTKMKLMIKKSQTLNALSYLIYQYRIGFPSRNGLQEWQRQPQ